MAEDLPTGDEMEFADKMKEFTSQADAPKSAKSGEAKGPAARSERAEVLLGVGDLVRPLAIDLDHIKRAGSDNNLLLTALGKTMNAQRNIPQSLEAISEQMKRLGAVESANQKLFDALHAELKTYKDNFLFDALQKPFIRDLVSLFDDFSAVHLQTAERLNALGDTGKETDERAFLERIHGNLDNNVHHMLEVFLRMNVTISQTPAGAPLDKKIHRTVAVTPAASAADDSLVERSVKPGFFWHERTVRPEEVVVRRWTPPAPAAVSEAVKETALLDPASEAPKDGLAGSPQ